MRLALLLCAGVSVLAQEGGQADIALQGYHTGGSVESTPGLTGLSAHFSSLQPGLGILQGSFEGAGYGRKLKAGDNYLELRGTPWLGRRWSFTGGDFRFSPSLVELPVTNLYYPDLNLRGGKIESATDHSRYAVFWGGATMLEGPRVPFRARLPQSVFGASARRELGRLTLGARLLRFRSNPSAGDEFLFPPGRRFRSATVAAIQGAYALSDHWKVFGEITGARSDLRPASSSQSAGTAWDSSHLTINLNWAHQNKLYYPAAGYFAGDRSGPFLEVRVRPARRLEVFGSANRYRNNVERDPSLPTYSSHSQSVGASARLPLAFTGSVQLSNLSFTSRGTGSEPSRESANRLLSTSLSRPFRRHTVRLTERRIDLNLDGRSQRQRTTEVEDSLQWGKLFAAGAVRLQRTAGSDRRNTLYYRGSLQTRIGRVSLGGHAELGSDLLNRTLFATSTYVTTVAAVSVRVSRTWSAEFEAFRNTATMELNPENVFVLGGAGAAVSSTLSAFNQWTTFFRIRKQISWGSSIPSGASDRILGRFVPLYGSVEGFVSEVTMDGRGVPVERMPVRLDEGTVVETDSSGRFRFAEVAEGPHRIALAVQSLPAEFDPGPASQIEVIVKPRNLTRADLEVVRLTSLEGSIAGAPGTPVENIVIRLAPAGRYTSTDADGRFAFHNLREGTYEASLDPTSLAPEVVALGPPSQQATVRLSSAAAPLSFRVELHKQERPVRRIELR